MSNTITANKLESFLVGCVVGIIAMGGLSMWILGQSAHRSEPLTPTLEITVTNGKADTTYYYEQF